MMGSVDDQKYAVDAYSGRRNIWLKMKLLPVIIFINKNVHISSGPGVKGTLETDDSTYSIYSVCLSRLLPHLASG